MEAFEKALRHVGYTDWKPPSDFQFQVLLDHGMKPTSRVLEIGCGCLVTGHRIIEHLDPGNYVGIEPAEWVTLAGRSFFKPSKPFRHSAAQNFDAGDGVFDFIHSHSVLSHVSRYQLPEYFAACRRQLAPGGIALASIRLCVSLDGRLNHSGGDSNDEAWLYPDITWFTQETVERVAREQNVKLTHRPDIRAAFMAATNDEHHHDWIQIEVEAA